MIKKLTQLGNSSALIIDRALMALMEIDSETPLKVSVTGRRLIVEPMDETERKARLTRMVKKTGQKNAELFKRLAR